MEHPDTIAATVLNMTAAFNEGDISGILCCYEPDAVVIGEPSKPAQGAAALRAMFAAPRIPQRTGSTPSPARCRFALDH